MFVRNYLVSASWLVRLALALVCLSGSIAYGARDIPFQFELDFDQDDYGDVIWVDEGATHEWIAGGGWSGGAAKIRPNTLADNTYAGLGQFYFEDKTQSRVHFRYLIKFGREFNPGNGAMKMGILNKVIEDRAARPILGLMNLGDGNPPYRTFCAGSGGGSRCHDTTEGWPNGDDPFKLIPPEAGVDEWISVELEGSTVAGEQIKIYVHTQDGRVSYGQGNPYAVYDVTHPGGTFSYIDVIGYNNGVAPNSDPENYYMVDELKVDTQYIGPPEGFVEDSEPPLVFEDSDSDGIEDSWEKTSFGDLDTATSMSDFDKDGYTDLQEYLNSIANETDPEKAHYDPKVINAPGGTGFNPFRSDSALWNLILPSILNASGDHDIN